MKLALRNLFFKLLNDKIFLQKINTSLTKTNKKVNYIFFGTFIIG